MVILPTQNPDGREADTRRNAYGFDMNRDWFARTQPETDAKVEMLRRYPPVLFIDAHEMGNTAGYFFPPNADPIYHEITDQAVGWINGLYGPAMQHVFDAREIPYFNYATYDLFYMGYGDTVPATGFGAAGMTFEKTSSDPTPQARLRAVPDAVDLAVAGGREQGRDPAAAGTTAGSRPSARARAGELEPNEVVQPGNTIEQPVPDLTVRQYFIRADEPAPGARGAVARAAPAADGRRSCGGSPRRWPCPTTRAYGRAPRAATLPGRHLRRLDGPAPEALGAGDAQRGHLRAVPVLLRRHGVEPAAALSTSAAATRARRWRWRRRRSGRWPSPPVPAAAGAAVDRAVLDVAAPSRAASSRRAGCAGCSTTGASTTSDVSADGDRGRRRSPAPTSCSCRTATPRATCRSRATRTRSRTSGRPARPRSASWVQGGGRYVGWLDGAVLAAAVGISSAHAHRRGRRGHLLAGRAGPRGERRLEPAARGRRAVACRRSGTRATWCGRRTASCRCATRPRARRTSSSRATRTGRRRSAGPRRSSTSASARAARWRSASSRTSARSPTARRRCCATRSSAPTRRRRPPAPRPCARRRRRGRRRGGPRGGWSPRAARSGSSCGVRDARAARAVVRRQDRRVRVVRGGGRVTFLIGGGRDLSGDEHRWGRTLERALRRRGRAGRHVPRALGAWEAEPAGVLPAGRPPAPGLTPRRRG